MLFDQQITVSVDEGCRTGGRGTAIAAGASRAARDAAASWIGWGTEEVYGSVIHDFQQFWRMIFLILVQEITPGRMEQRKFRRKFEGNLLKFHKNVNCFLEN